MKDRFKANVGDEKLGEENVLSNVLDFWIRVSIIDYEVVNEVQMVERVSEALNFDGQLVKVLRIAHHLLPNQKEVDLVADVKMDLERINVILGYVVGARLYVTVLLRVLEHFGKELEDKVAAVNGVGLVGEVCLPVKTIFNVRILIEASKVLVIVSNWRLEAEGDFVISVVGIMNFKSY